MNAVLVDLCDNLKDIEILTFKYQPLYTISERNIENSRVINPREYLNSTDFYYTEGIAAIQLKQQVEKLKSYISPDLFLSIESSIILFHEHSLRAIRSYIYALNKVLHLYPGAVFILPWCASSCNAYLYESEGEVQLTPNHIFYKKGDFLYSSLVQYLELHQIPYQVTSKPRLTAAYYLSYIVRRIARIFARLLFAGFKLLLAFFKAFQTKDSDKIYQDDHVNAFISRSPVHSEYLSTTAEKTKNSVLFLDTVPLHRSNINELFCRHFNFPVYNLSKYIHITDIIFLFTTCLQLLNLLLSFKNKELQLTSRDRNLPVAVDLYQFICEATVLGCEAELLLRRIKRCAGVNKFRMRSITHSEMFSQYPNFFYSCKADSSDILKINILSFGTYDLPPLPDTLLSDSFYSFNLKQCKDLRNYNPSANPEYSGNSFLSPLISDLEFGDFIFFFSQPYQAEQEIKILSQLILNYPDKLVYVEHPRTNSSYIKRLRHLFKQLYVLRSLDYFIHRNTYDSQIKFAITRTSNVGYRLILQGKPVIYMSDLPEGFSVSLDFFCDYPLLANTCDEVIDFIESSHSVESFISFRTSYLVSNYSILGPQELANSISST